MHAVTLVLIAAVAFAGWPLICRFSGASPTWMNSVVVGVSATCVCAWYWRSLKEAPGESIILFLIVAGAVNAIGIIAYGELIGKPAVEISSHIPAALILTVVFSAIGGIIFFGEPISWQKALGLALGVVAVLLMTIFTPAN